jgi:hypothetical protein
MNKVDFDLLTYPERLSFLREAAENEYSECVEVATLEVDETVFILWQYHGFYIEVAGSNSGIIIDAFEDMARLDKYLEFQSCG